MDPNEVHDGLTSSAAFSYQKSVMSSKEKGKKEKKKQEQERKRKRRKGGEEKKKRRNKWPTYPLTSKFNVDTIILKYRLDRDEGKKQRR